MAIVQLSIGLILLSTLLQKIALPYTGNALPVSTVAAPLLILFCLIKRKLVIDFTRMMIFSLFIIVASISLIAGDVKNFSSFTSLLLLIVVQFGLIFVPAQPYDFSKVSIFFRSIMIVFSIVGIAQTAAQHIGLGNVAFALDNSAPTWLTINTYHNLNPLSYGSAILKSNGFFFLEPAVFSQYIAIAIALEMSSGKSLFRLSIYALALMLCYSGTGLILLTIFFATHLKSHNRVSALLGFVILILFVIVLGTIIDLTPIFSRVSEFQTPNSSGHARFISVLYLIQQVNFSGFLPLLFGSGPGTIWRYSDEIPFLLYDPTYGKLIFEYGLLGSLLYGALIAKVCHDTSSAITPVIFAMYFLMGGYLTDASMISTILAFVSFNVRCTAITGPSDGLPRAVSNAWRRSPRHLKATVRGDDWPCPTGRSGV